jgi:hypothetical protein
MLIRSPLQAAVARGWNVTYAKGVNICDWVPAVRSKLSS